MSEETIAGLIDGIKQNLKTEILTIVGHDGADVQVIASANGQSGVRLTSAKFFADEYRLTPAQIKGTSTHTTVESFTDHIKTFNNVDSVFFASRSDLTLRAIYDYHAKEQPNNLQHRAVFAPKKSRQLNTWINSNKSPFNQAAFANFIEDNVLDVCDPPTASQRREGDETHIQVAKTLNTVVASPSKLLELARCIAIHESSTAKNFVKTDSNEVMLEYTTAHQDANGNRLSVPGLFLIGVPIFEGGDLYRILVRLRYRLNEGKVTWWYELHQYENSIDDAFEEIVSAVRTETGLTLYHGSSEG